MKLLSANELSRQWGITQRRLICLAKEGRIPGAKQYGRTWVFPADCQKPADKRTKAAKEESRAIVAGFRYPIFEHRDPASFSPALDAEELHMKAIVEAYHACRFREANRILGKLADTTKNRYHRISLLYEGCMIDMALCNAKQFLDHYNRLTLEFQDDFPYKTEMSQYLHQINTVLGYNGYYQSEFKIDPAYPYHESYLPRLIGLSSVHVFYTNNPILPEYLQTNEANCLLLEKYGYWSDLQMLHLALGIAYSVIDREREKNIHLEKALELAQKYNLYFQVTDTFFYMRKLYEPILPRFPENFITKLSKLCNDIHKTYVRFTDSLVISNIYKLLNASDYIFLLYALQRLSHAKIAEKLNISAGAVGKRYSEIYSALNVKNKVELVHLYSTYMKSQPPEEA